jgi:hypothetical protein
MPGVVDYRFEGSGSAKAALPANFGKSGLH